MPSRHPSRPALPSSPDLRFREARQQLQQLGYFLKGTVLKRMMKCGQPNCACHRDASQRHGPYFEWTYKVKGKTVNVKLSPQAATLYQDATKQHRKLKAALTSMERLSRIALAQLAKQAAKSPTDLAAQTVPLPPDRPGPLSYSVSITCPRLHWSVR